jgi:hypothetical protein
MSATVAVTAGEPVDSEQRGAVTERELFAARVDSRRGRPPASPAGGQ